MSLGRRSKSQPTSDVALAHSTLSRRAFVAGLIALSSHRRTPAAESSDTQLVTESQRGDLQLQYESIEVDRDVVNGLLNPSRASYEARASDFFSLVWKTARDFVGDSRKTDQESISKMLELFELPFQSKSGEYIPFCAAGLSYIVALAYVGYWGKKLSLSTLRGALQDIDHYHFFPSPSVWDMYNVAKAKRRWTDRSKSPIPLSGWLVIYDFGKGADHVGLVIQAGANGMKTFECNTSGNAAGSE